jgi:hypothetical protein
MAGNRMQRWLAHRRKVQPDSAIRFADFENDASPICRACKLPV